MSSSVKDIKAKFEVNVAKNDDVNGGGRPMAPMSARQIRERFESRARDNNGGVSSSSSPPIAPVRRESLEYMVSSSSSTLPNREQYKSSSSSVSPSYGRQPSPIEREKKPAVPPPPRKSTQPSSSFPIPPKSPPPRKSTQSQLPSSSVPVLPKSPPPPRKSTQPSSFPIPPKSPPPRKPTQPSRSPVPPKSPPPRKSTQSQLSSPVPPKSPPPRNRESVPAVQQRPSRPPPARPPPSRPKFQPTTPLPPSSTPTPAPTPSTSFCATETVIGGTRFRELSQHFVQVSEQVESGLYMLKRMITFLRKLATHMETFVTGVTKVTVHETGKEKTKHDSMRLHQRVWSSVQELVQTHASKHAQFRLQIQETLLPPVQEAYKAMVMERTVILKDLKVIQQETKTISTQVKSTKKTALKCLANLKMGMEKEAGEHAVKSGVFSQLKDKLNDLRLEDVPLMRQKAENACKAYSDAVNRANDKKTQTNRDVMPMIMDRLHAIEVKRLATMKECALMFGSMYQAMTKPLSTLGNELTLDAGPLTPNVDIDEFVEHAMQTFDAAPVSALRYDLPCTADDLRRGRWTGDMDLKTHDSIYGTSIETVMKLQSEHHPHAVMPMVFQVCVAAVMNLRGENEQGIFRISAKKSDLDAVRREFDSGNYGALEKYESAHVPAGALKQWLREMSEPLIPDTLYDKCVDMAKAAEASGEKRIEAKHIRSVIAQLSPVKKAMIRELAKMFSKIVDCSSVNMMGVSNLAIVFAPSFLRCDDDDPLLMLTNSKYESHFVSELINVAIHDI